MSPIQCPTKCEICSPSPLLFLSYGVVHWPECCFCRTLHRHLSSLANSFLGLGWKHIFEVKVTFDHQNLNRSASSPKGRWNQIWSNSLNTSWDIMFTRMAGNWDSNFSMKWGEWHLKSGAPGYTGLAYYYRNWHFVWICWNQRTEI